MPTSASLERITSLKSPPRCLRCKTLRMQTWEATLVILVRANLFIREAKLDPRDPKLAASIAASRDSMRHREHTVLTVTLAAGSARPASRDSTKS